MSPNPILLSLKPSPPTSFSHSILPSISTDLPQHDDTVRIGTTLGVDPAQVQVAVEAALAKAITTLSHSSGNLRSETNQPSKTNTKQEPAHGRPDRPFKRSKRDLWRALLRRQPTQDTSSTGSDTTNNSGTTSDGTNPSDTSNVEGGDSAASPSNTLSGSSDTSTASGDTSSSSSDGLPTVESASSVGSDAATAPSSASSESGTTYTPDGMNSGSSSEAMMSGEGATGGSDATPTANLSSGGSWHASTVSTDTTSANSQPSPSILYTAGGSDISATPSATQSAPRLIPNSSGSTASPEASDSHPMTTLGGSSGQDSTTSPTPLSDGGSASVNSGGSLSPTVEPTRSTSEHSPPSISSATPRLDSGVIPSAASPPTTAPSPSSNSPSDGPSSTPPSSPTSSNSPSPSLFGSGGTPTASSSTLPVAPGGGDTPPDGGVPVTTDQSSSITSTASPSVSTTPSVPQGFTELPSTTLTGGTNSAVTTPNSVPSGSTQSGNDVGSDGHSNSGSTSGGPQLGSDDQPVDDGQAEGSSQSEDELPSGSAVPSNGSTGSAAGSSSSSSNVANASGSVAQPSATGPSNTIAPSSAGTSTTGNTGFSTVITPSGTSGSAASGAEEPINTGLGESASSDDRFTEILQNSPSLFQAPSRPNIVGPNADTDNTIGSSTDGNQEGIPAGGTGSRLGSAGGNVFGFELGNNNDNNNNSDDDNDLGGSTFNTPARNPNTGFANPIFFSNPNLAPGSDSDNDIVGPGLNTGVRVGSGRGSSVNGQSEATNTDPISTSNLNNGGSFNGNPNGVNPLLNSAAGANNNLNRPSFFPGIAGNGNENAPQGTGFQPSTSFRLTSSFGSSPSINNAILGGTSNLGPSTPLLPVVGGTLFRTGSNPNNFNNGNTGFAGNTGSTDSSSNNGFSFNNGVGGNLVLPGAGPPFFPTNQGGDNDLPTLNSAPNEANTFGNSANNDNIFINNANGGNPFNNGGNGVAIQDPPNLNSGFLPSNGNPVVISGGGNNLNDGNPGNNFINNPVTTPASFFLAQPGTNSAASQGATSIGDGSSAGVGPLGFPSPSGFSSSSSSAFGVGGNRINNFATSTTNEVPQAFRTSNLNSNTGGNTREGNIDSSSVVQSFPGSNLGFNVGPFNSAASEAQSASTGSNNLAFAPSAQPGEIPHPISNTSPNGVDISGTGFGSTFVSLVGTDSVTGSTSQGSESPVTGNNPSSSSQTPGGEFRESNSLTSNNDDGRYASFTSKLGASSSIGSGTSGPTDFQGAALGSASNPPFASGTVSPEYNLGDSSKGPTLSPIYTVQNGGPVNSSSSDFGGNKSSLSQGSGGGVFSEVPTSSYVGSIQVPGSKSGLGSGSGVATGACGVSTKPLASSSAHFEVKMQNPWCGICHGGKYEVPLPAYVRGLACGSCYSTDDLGFCNSRRAV